MGPSRDAEAVPIRAKIAELALKQSPGLLWITHRWAGTGESLA
jgi:hypothetical protein